MLQQTDRLALAVPDADQAATDLNAIFDSIVVADTIDKVANARRVTLQWGHSQLELLEPKGDGPVASSVAQGKRGIFAAGFSLDHPDRLAAQLADAGVAVSQQGDRYTVFPDDMGGTGLILSPHQENERVGLNDRLWQVTFTVSDINVDVAKYRALLGLEDTFTSTYSHDEWGYDGAITWFHARKGAPLDSLEFLAPYDRNKAAGRFHDRTGGGIYMATVITDDIFTVRDRINETGGGWEASPGDEYVGFIHPRRTCGMLLGVATFDRFDANRPTPENPDTWGAH